MADSEGYFIFYCIVCKTFRHFPKVGNTIEASFEKGGWFCGGHTDKEINAAHPKYGCYNRLGILFQDEVGEIKAS